MREKRKLLYSDFTFLRAHLISDGRTAMCFAIFILLNNISLQDNIHHVRSALLFACILPTYFCFVIKNSMTAHYSLRVFIVS